MLAMPTLNWIGRGAVLNHDQQVAYHMLADLPELSCGPADAGNLIVQGDNLVALKSLLPYYAGRVKCIYIDPPYNTGVDDRDEKGRRTGWVYNDNVDSPEIREWLGKVVGERPHAQSHGITWCCCRSSGCLFSALESSLLCAQWTNTMAETWLTTDQAGKLVNFHPDHVRRLIRGGLVKAERFGPVWKVDRRSLLAYVRKMERRGDRRGPKR